jgi:uracil-DNA glycosylase
LLVGTYAQAAYLPETKGWTLQRRMEQAMDFLPRYLPLPHPAWRSTLFMRANPWFESKILPRLRTLVNQAIR